MGFGLYLFTILMNIDFLLTKLKGDSAVAKLDEIHSQHARVEISAGFNIAGCQNKVVDTREHHVLPAWRWIMKRGVHWCETEYNP